MSETTSPEASEPGLAGLSGGAAGSHAPVTGFSALVGPSTGAEFNTIRAALIPIACFRLDDVRFAFDSSFVLPEAEQELKLLADLIDQHTDAELPPPLQKPPLSVFGHADPVGSDEYNKTLSGRRAEAVYGLLTRQAAVWERLFSQPFLGDNWGLKSVQIMLDALLFDPQRQDGIMDGPTEDALKAFQREHALSDDGKAGQQTRKALFLAYMDALCRRDVGNLGGKPFAVSPGQFLGRGLDAKGKGDFQGCSDFNLVEILSQSENARLQAGPDKTERNAANAGNRRVLIFLFRPGTKIDPPKWPCPRAEEGPEGCRKRFWSDAARRRAPGTNLREFDKTHDTFACRFYQRLADSSPCEQFLQSIEIRLYDLSGKFIARAPFELRLGKAGPVRGTASSKGSLIVKHVQLPNRLQIRWGFEPAKGKAADFVFDSRIFLPDDGAVAPDAQTASPDSVPEILKEKLHNLGYPHENPPALNIMSFQQDYGHLAAPAIQADGLLNKATADLIREVYHSREDDLRDTRPADQSIA